MANEEILTDEYLAGLLVKDAKESSIKYSALGLEGFAQSKPPANKPKPNTRFLRNIIKETDSHNAALLAKEAAESRARLKNLAGNGHREVKASRAGGGDIRRRQLGDIAAILGGGPEKRRKVEEEKKPERRRRNTSSEEDEPEKPKDDRNKKYRSSEDDTEEERSFRSHRSHRHRRERSVSKDRGKNRDRRRRDRSRSLSPKEHPSKESRHRHRSPKRKRSRSPEGSREKSHRSSKTQWSPIDSNISRKEGEKSSRIPESRPDYDSDPLDDIIGPRPPPIPEVRSRGRGTMSGAYGMDSRFLANYDPTADVQLDMDEENDWDQALEALRDRQKWKQQGADRLRAAGFTEDEVKKWENGGEKREEDVKWAKKGEGREWDRGKKIDDEGTVTFEPSFGRLKDD